MKLVKHTNILHFKMAAGVHVEMHMQQRLNTCKNLIVNAIVDPGEYGEIRFTVLVKVMIQ